MRYRNFGVEKQLLNVSVRGVSNTGVVTVYQDYDIEMRRSHDLLYDVVTPDYKQRSANGEIIISPFKRLKLTHKFATGQAVQYNVNHGTNYFNSNSIYLLCHPALLEDHTVPPMREEINDAVADIKRYCAANLERSRYAFGEDLAEIHKTFGSLRGVLYDIGNIIARIPALTQRYMRNGATMQAAASKVWLRLRYELRPLLISAENLMQVLETEANTAVGKRDKVMGFRAIDINSTGTYEGTTAGGAGHWTITHTSTGTYKVNFGAIYENHSPCKSALETLGLGVKDVLPTMWAITRFSFLVDKFVNITQLIYGLENMLDGNINILGAWNNVAVEAETKYVMTEFDRTDYVCSCNLECSTSITNKFREVDSLNISDALAIDLVLPEYDTFIDLYSIFVSPSLNKLKLRVI